MGREELEALVRAALEEAGKRGVDQIHLVLVIDDAEVDAGRVDQCVGPRELDAIDARLDREQPMLADHRDVFRVVDRQLGALPARNGHQIDVGHRGIGGAQVDARRQTMLMRCRGLSRF